MQLQILLFNILAWLFLYSITSSPNAGQNALIPDSETRPDVSICLAQHNLARVHLASGRSFLLFTPPDTKSPLPLLIAFHGMGRSASYMLVETGWIAMANSEKFMVAFPDSDPRWTEERGSSMWEISKTGSPFPNPDVKFYKDVFDTLVNRKEGVRADNNKVYVLGISNGAVFAMNLLISPEIYPDHVPKGVVPWMGAWSSRFPTKKDEKLPKVMPPVFLIWGEKDSWAKPGSMEAVEALRKWGAKEVKAMEIPGFGHRWAVSGVLLQLGVDSGLDRYDPRTDGEIWAWFRSLD